MQADGVDPTPNPRDPRAPAATQQWCPHLPQWASQLQWRAGGAAAGALLCRRCGGGRAGWLRARRRGLLPLPPPPACTWLPLLGAPACRCLPPLPRTNTGAQCGGRAAGRGPFDDPGSFGDPRSSHHCQEVVHAGCAGASILTQP